MVGLNNTADDGGGGPRAATKEVMTRRTMVSGGMLMWIVPWIQSKWIDPSLDCEICRIIRELRIVICWLRIVF